MNTLCRNSTYTMNNFHSCRYMGGMGESADPSSHGPGSTMPPGTADLINCLSSMASNDVTDTSVQDESFDLVIALAMLDADSLSDTGGGGAGGGEDLVAGYPSSVDTESPVSTPSPHYHPATPTYPHPNHFHFPDPMQQHSPMQQQQHPHLSSHHQHIGEHQPDFSLCIKQESDTSQDCHDTPVQVKHRRGPRRVSQTDLSQDDDPDTERKERRRQQNRMAARRCRERKKVQRTAIVKEYYELVSANAELQSRIQNLEVEKNRLHDTLQRHRRSCSLQF